MPRPPFFVQQKGQVLYSVHITEIPHERSLVKLIPLINSIVIEDKDMRLHSMTITPTVLERLPCRVRRNMSLAEAEELLAELTEAGAVAVIEQQPVI